MLKYSVKFSLKKTDTTEPESVRARVSFHSTRVEIYTGVKALPSEWDGVRIKKRSDARNAKLAEIERRVEDVFKNFDFLHKRYPTKEEFKKMFAGKKTDHTKTEDLLFTELIKLYIAEKSVSKQWEPLTLRKYEKLYNHITAFRKNLRVNEVTQTTLRELITYFSTTPKHPKTGDQLKPHRNTTIRRTIADYISILRWGASKNLYSGTAHINFEQRYKGTAEKLSELVYLEWDELIELFNHKFEKDKHSKVRDVFCFCCFSSLRFSDVKKLKKTDIRKDSILVSTKKTTDPLIIDLNNYSRAILEKYKDLPIENNLALPVISLDKTNEYLREIGEIMKWETPIRQHYFIGTKSIEHSIPKKNLISTHAGRRTFVINALRLGISSDVIIKWTGHKDFSALKPYIKIVDELKRKEMDKFNFVPENIPETK